MIRIDRKTCRDILSLTKSYNVDLFFSPDHGGYSYWHSSHPKSIDKTPSINVKEVPDSLSRLAKQGLIKKIQGIMGGGMIFRITPELLHYKAFWFDRFTKKFFGGFVSGIAVTVIADLIIRFIASLI